MFGYIRPQKPEMLIKDFDAYKAAYCSLCRQLGKSYGFAASLILSYDSTFFAILSMSVKGECNSYKKGRCKVNPTKKCDYCSTRSISLENAAALSAAAFYYKLEDEIADGSLLRRILLKPVRLFAGRWRKKLIKYGYRSYDLIFENMLKEQLALESEGCKSIDRAAEPTAKALSQLAGMLSDDEAQRRVLESFGYYLGKWVYLMDAADDINDDIKSGCFNPFVLYFSLDENYDRNILKQINGIINEAASMLLNAYNLIELKGNQRILENIVTLGISSMQKYVLFDKRTEKSKNKNKI